MRQQGRGGYEYVNDETPRAAKPVLLSFHLLLVNLI
jgi:hypothetical protein